VRLLEKEKRRIRDVDVNIVAETIISLFRYLESDYNAAFAAEVAGFPLLVRASEAGIESIIVNLLTNALTAIASPDAPKKGRSVILRTEAVGETVVIRVLDSGPGIAMKLSDIWLPGRTTTELGSGIGLTIVRDITLELGGEVGALKTGELGGAEVWSAIPTAKDK
jgi:C4-dicarboxylate-specific signal transduction histidine kinase